MPRLFSAVEIPQHIRDELTRLQSGLDHARWIDAENFHITLRFIGDVDEREAEEFSGFLSNIEFAPFDIALKSLGSFGGRRPRAVWIGMDTSPALIDLHHAHEMAAQKAGLGSESRKYIPHVTLARLRNTSSEETAHYLESFGAVSLPSFTVYRTALYSARPGGGGGPYRLEMTYPGNPSLLEAQSGDF